MGAKLILDENYIVNEYIKGKSSIMLERELGVSKPTILKILKNHGVTKKRDRCKSLNIVNSGNKFTVIRKCPKCDKSVKVSSNSHSVTCRNYYNFIKKESLCKKCSLELQKGISNPFYGKKHTETTLKKISQKISSNPPKHSSVSNKEKKLLTELKKMSQQPLGSYSVGQYICDIYIQKHNLIIEFNGDYWHCNPKKYSPDYLHPHKKKTAKDIWEEDKIRIDKIKKYGYNLEVIWESDFNDLSHLKKIITKYERKN